MLDATTKKHIETLWNYNQLNEELPERADAIIVPGCCDLSVVDRAVELYHAGISDIVVMTGDRGPMTLHNKETEALTFAERAHEFGVPKPALFLEENATNTGENVRYSDRLLTELGRTASSVVIVQKPYLERRVRATFDKQWGSETNGYVTSIQNSDGLPMSFDEYVTMRTADERDIANYVLDTMHRIITYPERGYHTEQNMTPDILASYKMARLALTRLSVSNRYTGSR